MVNIQRVDYGGGEVYFDGELIRREWRFSSETVTVSEPEPFRESRRELSALALQSPS